QVVHVGPVAVDLLPDAVPGAVDEVRAVAGLLDHGPTGSVDLVAPQRPARGERLANEGNRRIPGAGDDAEDLRVTRRDLLADEPDAGQVAVDAPGPVHLRPEVDEDEFAGPDRGVVRTGFGFEVGVAAVRACAD